MRHYHSLMSFAAGASRRCRPVEGLTSFKTPSYALHLFESPTGYRFVVTSDGSQGDLRPSLRHIYSEIFVPYVLRNPLYKMNTEVTNHRFKAELATFTEKLGT